MGGKFYDVNVENEVAGNFGKHKKISRFCGKFEFNSENFNEKILKILWKKI